MCFLKFLIFFENICIVNIILKCYIFIGVLYSINLKKKPNRRLDFLPNVQNKYSIRKFTVGAASILVGATLIFGAGQEEAKAAESDQTVTNQNNTSSPTDTTEQPSTEEKVTSENITTDQPSPEEKATSENITTDQPSAEEKAAESTQTDESSAEEKAAESTQTDESLAEEKAAESTQTDESSAEEKAAESTQTDESSPEEKEANDSTETNQSSLDKYEITSDVVEQPEASASIQTISEELNVSSNDTVQALENAGVDTSNATEVEAIAALIQNDYANNSNETPVVTPLNINSATARNEETTNTLRPRLFAARALAADTPTNDNVSNTDNNRIIEADAIKNGYIKSQTDATNAANTLSGRAWVVDQGTPATMSNGLTPVPDGTAVYMQWIDTDGVVSPIYRAHTNNSLSTSNGSQVGPGAYAFDLRQAYTDANGKEHKYSATSGQYYKLWIEDYQTKNGNTVTMLRQAGGFFPGSYVNSVTSNNIGQFPLIGTNMQRTGIYMGVKPSSDYMTTSKDQWIHDTQGPISNAAVNTKAKNTVSGQVWLETGTGVDLANSAAGPNLSGNDKVAPGYTVVMSSLTSEGVQAYKAAVDSLPESERADAAKVLLSDHPEYISATVYGETDSNGRYTLRFPDGTLNDEYMYGYVVNPNGEVQNAYSSFTSPQFRSPMANSSFVPQSRPGQNLIVNPMWYNLNFALVPQNDVKIDITNYNNTTKPARPGDVAQIDLSGTQLSPLPTHIEWRDKNGNVVSKTDDITSFTDGEQKGQFTVPASAQSGDVYTVFLVTGGKDVGSDSFVVATDKAAYEPTTDGVTKDYGDPTTEDDVTGAVTIPDYPSEKGTPTITVDDPSTLPNGNTPGTVDVPVTVTYPDGTEDHVTVPVTTNEQADNDAYQPTTDEVTKDYGTPTTEEDVTRAVTIPDYPSEKGTPTITVDDPSTLPDGNTPGTVDVPVTVTYPDGTEDHVTVPVTTNEQADNDAYQPTTDEVTKDYGTPTTEEDVTGAVTIPDYPSEKEQPVITVDDPNQLPDGNTPGTTEVDVTVTYPDGTKDHVKVPVTVGEETQANTNDPSYDNVTVDPGETVKVPQTGDNTMPDGTQYEIDKSKIPSGWEVTVDHNTGELTVKPSEDAVPGTSIVIPVTVTYPDGSTEEASTTITVGDVIDIPAPTVNPVDDNDTEVTGTDGTPGNTIVVTFPDGSTSEGNIDEDGNWTVDIPDGVDLDKGDVITVVEKDKDGKVSTPTKVVVGENCDNPSNGDNSGDGAGNDSSDGDNSEDGADKGSSNEDNSKDEEGNNSLDSNNSVEGNKDSLTDNNATTDSNNTASVNNTDQTDSNNDVSELNEDNNTSNNTHKQNNSEAKALPETGNNEQNNGTLLGSLFAAAGTLFLAGKRRKNRSDKK